MDARSPELARATYMYVTTYSQAGKPGTVPTWLWPHEDAVYFTTRRDSVKARRIRNNGRVTVHVGTKDGPAFEGRAEWVDDRPDLEAALPSTYPWEDWPPVPLFLGGHIRPGLGAETNLLLRLTPPTQRAE